MLSAFLSFFQFSTYKFTTKVGPLNMIVKQKAFIFLNGMLKSPLCRVCTMAVRMY